MTGSPLSTEESVTRRLSSLQRGLTQALGEPEPVIAVTERLMGVCNATVALIDPRGATVSATGPIPLTLLFSQITRTIADTQMIDIDGWHGVADRVTDPSQGGDHAGWLVVVNRRANFPDAYSIAAVHVAAALVEAGMRMTTVAQQQERAIRAAVLEEALAVQRQPSDAGLTGRIASLGLSFEDELRVVLVQPRRRKPNSRGQSATTELSVQIARALKASGIPYLMSVRDLSVIVLVQCTPATLSRTLVAGEVEPSKILAGIGRSVTAPGEVADSYHDAQLGVRTLTRRGAGQWTMAYEELDFATRLFAEVGLDRMSSWAREFVGPLVDRPALSAGLQAFLQHDQNIIAAAESLGIHHNSLRYRLTKVEELLKINLRQPSAISSVFLALAALELDGDNLSRPKPERVKSISQQAFDIDAPIDTGYPVQVSGSLGVVGAPE